MKLIALLFCVLTVFTGLYACDMFGLIAIDGQGLSNHSQKVREYFDFLISRSSDTSNNDGYGIIACRKTSSQSVVTDSWYKTGKDVWYGDGTEEPLDDAFAAVIDEANNYFLVIAHARNATGGNGSHPFIINTNTTSYALCHNGVIPYSLRQIIMEYLGDVWFDTYPSNWYGVFGEVTSFIDSELYHHYLVNTILHEQQGTFHGLATALSENNLMGLDAASFFLDARCSANILFSDGSSLYAFKNTRSSSSQRLSWQDHGGVIGIKTQDINETALQQNELISFSGQGDICSQVLEYEEEDEFVPARHFYAQPNPALSDVYFYFQPERKDDEQNDNPFAANEVTIYNIKGEKVRAIQRMAVNDDYEVYHWDGYIAAGYRAPAGVYFAKHQFSGRTCKLLLLK